MIEINLIPYSLRKKRKSKLSLQGFKIPPEIMIGLGGGLLVLLVFVHIVLVVLNIRNVIHYKQLKEQQEEILPLKKESDKIVNELRALQATKKAMENIAPEQKILWAEKLNILSDSIPRGVWLRKVKLEGNILTIEGSAIATDTDSEAIINVHKFASNLKGQKEFLGHFNDMELGSIHRRKVKQVDIADFLVTVRLK